LGSVCPSSIIVALLLFQFGPKGRNVFKQREKTMGEKKAIGAQ
jgi:hypothetical protein